jgi:hypothetical protein
MAAKRFATSVRHHASLVRATPDVGDLVGDVVHLAAERIERGDGATPLRREEEEAVVELDPLAAAFCWQYSSGVMSAQRLG